MEVEEFIEHYNGAGGTLLPGYFQEAQNHDSERRSVGKKRSSAYTGGFKERSAGGQDDGSKATTSTTSEEVSNLADVLAQPKVKQVRVDKKRKGELAAVPRRSKRKVIA